MNILLRSENKYEEESKEVIWVFPNIIYPKDNNTLNKEEDIKN